MGVDTSSLAGILAASKPRRTTQRTYTPAPLALDRARNVDYTPDVGRTNTAGEPTTSAQYDQFGGDLAFARADALRTARGQVPYMFGGQQAPQPMFGVGASGGGSGSGGGGGGYAGPSAADFGAYANAMRQFLSSGAFQAGPARTTNLDSLIGPAVQRERGEAADAFAALAGDVSLEDPYLQLIGQSIPQFDPGVGEYAAAQGIELGDETQVARDDLANLAANWNALAGVLGTSQVARQQGVLDASKQQAATVDANFGAEELALRAMAQRMNEQYASEAAAEKRALDAAKRDAVLQLLSTGLQFGATPDVSGVF